METIADERRYTDAMHLYTLAAVTAKKYQFRALDVDERINDYVAALGEHIERELGLDAIEGP